MTYTAHVCFSKTQNDADEIFIFRAGEKIAKIEVPAEVPDGPNQGGTLLIARVKWALENAGYKFVPNSATDLHEEYVEYTVDMVTAGPASSADIAAMPEAVQEIFRRAVDTRIALDRVKGAPQPKKPHLLDNKDRLEGAFSAYFNALRVLTGIESTSQLRNLIDQAAQNKA